MASSLQPLADAPAPAPWLSAGAIAVLGSGSALPGPVVETGALLDAVAEWLDPAGRDRAEAVAAKLAIRTRHVARAWHARFEDPAPGAANPDLAARAVRAALDDAGVEIGDVAYLIGHTATPVQALPGNIAFVADRLGYAGPHLELRQACTGFANALMIAFGLLARPGARPVVIVGSETGSAWFDPASLRTDPGQIVNLVQMGDGAGAVVLGPPRPGADRLDAAWFGAIGLGRTPGIHQRAFGGGDGPAAFEHDFRAILETGHALFEAGVAAAARHGFALDDADNIVPHQVSGRIGSQFAAHFGVAAERVVVDAGRIGNTGSAAIWLALDALRRRGQGRRALFLGAEATKFMHGGFVLTAA